MLVGMGLLDLVFPTGCVGCGAGSRLVCGRCAPELIGPARLVWPRPSPPGLPAPWAVASYAGPVRTMVLAYKERGSLALGRWLAPPLADGLIAAARPAGSSQVLIVAVPSARAAIRDRGDDVMLMLARRAAGLARRQGVAVRVVDGLRHTRVVADSAGLSARDRAANLDRALVVRSSALRVLDGADVVIADDLITSGATLAEATRALRSAGSRVLGAGMVAATRRRDDPRGLGARAGEATVGTYG
jgi:predicted amidophosphoribosyltransferase